MLGNTAVYVCMVYIFSERVSEASKSEQSFYKFFSYAEVMGGHTLCLNMVTYTRS